MTDELNKKLSQITTGRNFRELGGYKTTKGQVIKKHKLLRTGNLATLSPQDLAFLEDYGVKYVVDFRSQKEIDSQKDRVPSGAQYVFAPVFSVDLTESEASEQDILKQAKDDPDFGKKHMFKAYENMLTSDTAAKAYRDYFSLLLANKNENESLIFHCTAGKDRTGVGAILILSALGVPLKTIKEDYLLTNVITKDFLENFVIQAKAKGASPEAIQVLKDFQGVRPEYFDHILEVIEKNYGNINNYLHTVIGLSADDLASLQSIYLA